MIAAATARGILGAMAMTGVRQVTTGLGFVDQTPPAAILTKAGGLLAAVSTEHRRAAIELAHWSYGAGGGAAFSLLPRSLRSSRWAGPGYGVGIWLLFELGIAPALGLPHARERRLRERLAFAGDHILYGIVVAGGR